MSQKKKERFLEAYAELGTITHAAEAAGVDRRTHYRWLEDDETYKEAFLAAEEAVADLLEREALRRAIEGTERIIYHQGEPVGAERQFSDTLLIFLMKGHKPDKYRERVHVKSEAEVTIHAKNDLDREIEGLMADLAGRRQSGTPVAAEGPGDTTRP